MKGKKETKLSLDCQSSPCEMEEERKLAASAWVSSNTNQMSFVFGPHSDPKQSWTLAVSCK